MPSLELTFCHSALANMVKSNTQHFPWNRICTPHLHSWRDAACPSGKKVWGNKVIVCIRYKYTIIYLKWTFVPYQIIHRFMQHTLGWFSILWHVLQKSINFLTSEHVCIMSTNSKALGLCQVIYYTLPNVLIGGVESSLAQIKMADDCSLRVVLRPTLYL